ncbi:MAG TPA: hypothetical protein VN788_01530 [Verrucomicrobiae bacterium]|nr:hypothetical protein [Verrucomicrobiae bacterium]
MKERQKSLELALEEAVSRALRDNLAPLQRTADELHQAYSDLVAACSSTRPSNALPAMLRAQTAASALAAGLSVLSNFVAVALNPREALYSDDLPLSTESAVAVQEPANIPDVPHVPHLEGAAPAAIAEDAESEWAEAAEEVQDIPVSTPENSPAAAPPSTVTAEPPATAVPAFDVASLTPDLQDLHRRANRVAKVAMQDIKLLRPKDVRLGRENKDICIRLRSDLDKARKEYDRRFRAIQDHPVDYFQRWMVEILAEGDVATLGEYPYPSPVLRH